MPSTLAGCSAGSPVPSLLAFGLPGNFTQWAGAGWGVSWQEMRRREEGESWGISLVTLAESRSFHGSSSYQMTPLSVAALTTGQTFSLSFLPLALGGRGFLPRSCLECLIIPARLLSSSSLGIDYVSSDCFRWSSACKYPGIPGGEEGSCDPGSG